MELSIISIVYSDKATSDRFLMIIYKDNEFEYYSSFLTLILMILGLHNIFIKYRK